VVSNVYPFITATEFHRALRAGSGPSGRLPFAPHSADVVARAVVEVLETGEPERVLVPPEASERR